jgi:hypothetical protein
MNGYFLFAAFLIFSSMRAPESFASEKVVVQDNYKPPMKIDSDLEGIMIRMLKNPALRSEFHQRLLNTTVYAIQEKGNIPLGNQAPRVAQKDEQVRIRITQIDGRTMTPIFTSLEHMESFVNSGAAAYLGMKAADFLRMTQGSILILNPGTASAVTLNPKEVAEILKAESPK